MTQYADEKFDVYIRKIELKDYPATVKIYYSVAKMQFTTLIKYHSIQSWDEISLKLTSTHHFNRMIAMIAAWDAMRYLSLGGCTLILPQNYGLNTQDQQIWQHCFYNQFGEWRYKNQLTYADDLPAIQCSTNHSYDIKGSTDYHAKKNKLLLANGGGKDTLLGCILLSEEPEYTYDLFHGFLPYGGCQTTQKRLLEQLSDAFTPDNAPVSIEISDNFCDKPETFFISQGVSVTDYHTDFSVGHTSNYVGYFPILIAHSYEIMFFNIEKSADHANCEWRGYEINHQWCKSTDYRNICTQLFHSLVNNTSFIGFKSTIKGFYDTSIYMILSQHQDKLPLTHSCNIGKPWCKACTKCCFCYLMMTAFCSEKVAMEVLGITSSLFLSNEAQTAWDDLLNPEKHAWECVASKEECHLVCSICLKNGYTYPILSRYLNGNIEQIINENMNLFAEVDSAQFEHSMFNNALIGNKPERKPAV